jgi:hypothetical protein
MNNRRLSKILLLVVTVLFFKVVTASDGEPQQRFSLKDRVFFGGGATLSFGNITVIGASPIVGFKFNKRLAAGVGVDYLYYREKWQRTGPVYETSIYGANVFARYRISEKLFAHAEYGFTNWEIPVFDPVAYRYTTERRNVPHMLLGGGYIQPISQRSSFILMALYDALYNPLTSVNPRPFIFRAGFNVGF